MALAPGQMVTANIRLSHLLGQGGMGSVWAAEHLALQTHVAVKFMSPVFVENPALVARFTREATSAAQIKSPHVVQILDYGVSLEGLPYIVMELLEGEDLGRHLKRLGPMPVAEVAVIVTQVAKALAKAHAIGIVHRDIKPDNIFLIDADGDVFVKVLDFGIAKQQQDINSGMTSTGSTVGTPFYMSPEQLLSAKHVDHRSDLWSLAVVAYRVLTGKLPFRGETLGALSVAVHQGVFAMPSTHRKDLPPAIDAWFARALNRDPAMRFDAAKTLAEEFERAALGVTRPRFASELGLAPLPQMAPPPAPSQPTPPPAPSQPTAPPQLTSPSQLTPPPPLTPAPLASSSPFTPPPLAASSPLAQASMNVPPAASSSPMLGHTAATVISQPVTFGGSTITHAGTGRKVSPMIMLAGALAAGAVVLAIVIVFVTSSSSSDAAAIAASSDPVATAAPTSTPVETAARAVAQAASADPQPAASADPQPAAPAATTSAVVPPEQTAKAKESSPPLSSAPTHYRPKGRDRGF